jgi:hypothetical protein
MVEWLSQLGGADTRPVGLAEWAEKYPTLHEAWKSCPRSDWIVWMATQSHPDEARKKQIVLEAASDATLKKDNLFGKLAWLFRAGYLDIEVAETFVRGEIDSSQRPRNWVRNYALTLVTAVPLALAIMLLTPLHNTWKQGGWYSAFNFWFWLIVVASYVPLTFVFQAIRSASLKRALATMTIDKAVAIAVRAACDSVATWDENRRKYNLPATLKRLPPP